MRSCFESIIYVYIRIYNDSLRTFYSPSVDIVSAFFAYKKLRNWRLCCYRFLHPLYYPAKPNHCWLCATTFTSKMIVDHTVDKTIYCFRNLFKWHTPVARLRFACWNIEWQMENFVGMWVMDPDWFSRMQILLHEIGLGRGYYKKFKL